MLKLASFTNPRFAQAFIDYMAYRHIELSMRYEPDEQQYELWLIKLEDRVEAEAELAAFLQDPNHKKYQSASWEMAESRRAKYHYRSVSFWQKLKQDAGFLTLSIMGTCTLIYLALLLGFGSPILNALHFPASMQERWQLWRLFSHALMHFSTLHLVFNLLWWWILAGRIEIQLGASKLLQLFLLSALFSGLAQYQFEGPAFGGLSGVVYALLGYCWILTRLAPQKNLSIESSYFGFMLIWLVLGFAEPFGMKIANMAHLFGLISGLALGLLEAKRASKKV